MRQWLERRPHLVPCLLAAVMLLLALGRLPSGYYQLLRWVVCPASVFVAFRAYNFRATWAVWLFGIIAVLFNPISPVYMKRNTWHVLDLVAALIFIAAIFTVRAPKGVESDRRLQPRPLTPDEARKVSEGFAREMNTMARFKARRSDGSVGHAPGVRTKQEP